MNKATADRLGVPVATGIAYAVRSLARRVRIASIDREDSRPTPASNQELAIERRRELGRFYARFESYVDTLCQASQFGADGPRETAYQQDRIHLRRVYPELAPRLAAYLRPQTEDAEILLAIGTEGGDAIDALLAPGTLAEFVAADDGSVIPRINRAREALILYGEQLRRLAAR